MYRYCVDNAVTYTSEDFVLFRESPFACWMERLTLENPDHGILPDRDSEPPSNYMQRQDDLADTLREEEKNVFLVEWNQDESLRRSATLDAMRRGVDFIVNGQLALGPLSGSANLLMRTSGFSELGDFLYIPCDTQAKTTLNSAFRLCFLADLLHSLQGQLPPQMLIIRGGSDLLPLQTEDHIYHYRAVKQRFMEAMRTFRKHRMPDPAQSAQFGRWSECANEVMKQRALQGEEAPVKAPEEIDNPLLMPQAAAAGNQPVQVDLPQITQDGVQARMDGSRGVAVSGTLADQARMMQPEVTVVSSEVPAQGFARATPTTLDSALQNLEFIGSSQRAPTIGAESVPVPAAPGPRLFTEPPVDKPADIPPTPSPELSFSPEELSVLQEPAEDAMTAVEAVLALDCAPAVAPISISDPIATADPMPVAEPMPMADTTPVYAAPGSNKPHPLDSSGFVVADDAVIDRDDVTALPLDVDCIDDSDYRMPGYDMEEDPGEPDLPLRPFSNSLNTSGTDRD